MTSQPTTVAVQVGTRYPTAGVVIVLPPLGSVHSFDEDKEFSYSQSFVDKCGRPLVASTPKRLVFGRIKKRLQFGSGKTAESPIRKIIILDTSTSTHNNTVQTWEQYLEERVSNLERELETLKKELAPRRILRKL
uniref:Uncharacterized protein n=1 Tax=Magallana gigas TaxID=29159 RepID=K1PCZ0_MAGGI